MTPDLTVAIPTAGREADCHRAIESVQRLRQDADIAIELIVVEQGDRPTYRVPDDFRGRWMFSRRCGLTHARNVALALARAPAIYYVDDDARLEIGALTLFETWRATGAAMVCGRLRCEHGTIIRGTDRRVVVRGWSASRYFAEPAALWDVAALRDVGGFDERVGPPNRLGGEDGAQMLGRLADAGRGFGVYVPVDVAVHPRFDAAPPAKARAYGRALTGGFALDPNPWHATYIAASVLRRVGGLLVAALRRDRAGAAHRAAWLYGSLTGVMVGLSERRRPRNHPPELSTLASTGS